MPARQMLPVEQWLEIDRYALALTRNCRPNASRLRALRIPQAVQALQNFCSEDLGAFYLDILKDRLYTTAADSVSRRSAQTRCGTSSRP
jgi:isoleucyl-tRNA synthetase